MSSTRMSGAEQANFVCAKIVAHAMAYVDGRNDRQQLGRNAQSDMIELVVCSDDPDARTILDPARLLVIAMIGTASAEDDGRRARWCDVMVALVGMVRHESHELRHSGVQRS